MINGLILPPEIEECLIYTIDDLNNENSKRLAKTYNFKSGTEILSTYQDKRFDNEIESIMNSDYNEKYLQGKEDFISKIFAAKAITNYELTERKAISFAIKITGNVGVPYFGFTQQSPELHYGAAIMAESLIEKLNIIKEDNATNHYNNNNA